jgi:thiol-disulfide isomerase/thioredoxin
MSRLFRPAFLKPLFITAAFLSVFPSCESDSTQQQAQDEVFLWRGVFDLGNVELPINFYLDENKASFRNGAEKLDAEVFWNEDSVRILSTLFGTEFRLKTTGDMLSGAWHDPSRAADYQIPFRAKPDPGYRFDALEQQAIQNPSPFAAQDWRVQFIYEGDTSLGLGRFEHFQEAAIPDQAGNPGRQEAPRNEIRGTILTPTGDYRFLQGLAKDDSLYLSTFDGSHVFLFHAAMEGSQITGQFYSGTHWQEDWIAERDANFKLPDANSLSRATDEAVELCLNNLEGEQLCLDDQRFAGKPLLIQVMGSWCPNCMDETDFFRQAYDLYQPEGFELISVAFERGANENDWRKGAQRLRDHYNIDWPILLGGKASKTGAAEVLPFVDQIISFPTSIYLDRSHQIVRVHSGFSGPATGTDMEAFQDSFFETMNDLMGTDFDLSDLSN